ncbi:MAG: hypothetical protein LBT88_08670 [Oscillospiraceae bacterium]|jgi:hypothetical protein|nr:hypothetical protein [Oscillospiraceae bacterium]
MKLLGKYLHEGHHHDHGDGHTHSHDSAELAALLGYAIEHNAHHAEELQELARCFEAADLLEVAQQIEGAVEGIQTAVDVLGIAQFMLNDSKEGK